MLLLPGRRSSKKKKNTLLFQNLFYLSTMHYTSPSQGNMGSCCFQPFFLLSFIAFIFLTVGLCLSERLKRTSNDETNSTTEHLAATHRMDSDEEDFDDSNYPMG